MNRKISQKWYAKITPFGVIGIMFVVLFLLLRVSNNMLNTMITSPTQCSQITQRLDDMTVRQLKIIQNQAKIIRYLSRIETENAALLDLFNWETKNGKKSVKK
jgi:hypothetical protein